MMPGQNSGSAFPGNPAIYQGLTNMGAQLAQAGAPSQYQISPFAGLGAAGQGFQQGVQQYQDQQAQDELLQLKRQELQLGQKKTQADIDKANRDATADAAKVANLEKMAQTPPQSWTGGIQSWQNLVLTSPDSAAKWYQPQELKAMTETSGGQQREVLYHPMTGEVVKAGDYAPRWQPQQAPQANEFSSWLEAFKRDNNRNPTAKEIADRDKRLTDSIEYKNVIENGKVSTLPVGPELDAAIGRGAVITGTTTQLTEAQGKAGMQFAMSKQANAKLDKVDQVLTSPGDFIASKFGTAGNYAKSDEYQQAEQAANAMAEAYLRAITGAAAMESEIERVKQTILPQPGNDAGTIAQKKAQRAMIVETLRLMSGSMAGQVDALGGTEAPTEDPLGIR